MVPASKIAYRRLNPSLTDPSYLPLRSRRIILSSWVKQFYGKHLSVLDLGSRHQPYRPLFHSIDRFVTMDLIKSDYVSVQADAENLPFAAATFDVVIATQVFEYFRDPREVARHIHDIIKPGGTLLASFASFAPRFVDNERYRFTRSGLRLILEPFEYVEIVPELHSLGGLVRNVNLGLDMFVRYKSARRVYRWTVCPILNMFGLGLEKLNLTENDQFTSNYSVRAVKSTKICVPTQPGRN